MIVVADKQLQLVVAQEPNEDDEWWWWWEAMANYHHPYEGDFVFGVEADQTLHYPN